MDVYDQGSIIQYSSHKSRRATRLSRTEETVALADGFDDVPFLTHYFQRVLVKHLHVLMTESERVLDTIYRKPFNNGNLSYG